MAPSPPTIRVVVVDDHPLLRAGIISVLRQQSSIEVIGEAGTVEDGVAIVSTARPDVTLMDLQMPGLDGVAGIKMIRQRVPDAKVLVLTTFDTDDDIDAALRAGARGYLLKDASPHELAAAIRDVHAGKTRVAPAIAAKLAERLTKVQLTVRELSVLRLLAEGKSNREIGQALAITEGTVKVHVTHLLDKLEVKSRTEAIAEGARRGLLRLR